MATKRTPTKLVHVQEERLRSIVREESTAAAESALQTTLLKLGVRTETQEDVIETQKDMAFIRAFRKGMQAGGSRAVMALVSLVVMGVIAAVLASLGIGKSWFYSIPTS